LSKGHSALVLYSILNQVGLINDKELESYHKFKSSLLGHPVKNRKLGIEFSTGSLGMGLSLANGLAYLKKVNNSLGSVFCLLGDGEINEGSVWESIQFAAHHSLSQLICLIDNNGYQQTGSLTEISNSGNILEKFQSFKWHVTYIDGHDTTQLANAISAAVNSQTGLPNAIVCQTVKGKGVKDMENNNKWHHSLLSVTQYEIFKESIY
jgi:transketolase